MPQSIRNYYERNIAITQTTNLIVILKDGEGGKWLLVNTDVEEDEDFKLVSVAIHPDGTHEVFNADSKVTINLGTIEKVYLTDGEQAYHQLIHGIEDDRSSHTSFIYKDSIETDGKYFSRDFRFSTPSDGNYKGFMANVKITSGTNGTTKNCLANWNLM